MIREEITAGAFQADLEEWEIAFLLREMSGVHLLPNSLRNRHGGTLILPLASTPCCVLQGEDS